MGQTTDCCCILEQGPKPRSQHSWALRHPWHMSQACWSQHPSKIPVCAIAIYLFKMCPPPRPLPAWFQVDTIFLTRDLNHGGASLCCIECLVFLILMLVNFRCKVIFSFQAKSHVCSCQKTKVTTDSKSRIN